MSTADAARGVVFLVGAGPGDPDLITVRGAEALRAADVVLYDELAAEELLDLAPASAERIPVGKRGHDAPTRNQDDINRLLVEHAKRGRRVVRLKGGDVFVFGRGGEEASACREAGVRFEVIPGVSSALAALAYAGIPITDRRHAASFAVVTGHKDPTRVSEATRWSELGTAVDTLVVLMGRKNLPELAAKLIAGGKDPATPSAAIMNGTLPNQRVVEAPLGQLAERVEAAGLQAPVTIVVGDVVSLRRELAWVEEAPLHGLRVLVTRASGHASETVRAIRLAGGQPVLMPMIELELPDDCAPLDAAVAALSDYDALAVASPNAVAFLVQRARDIGRSDALAHFEGRVFCVGPKTAETARAAGLATHLVASGGAEVLVEEIAKDFSPQGKRFLVPRSEIGREVVAEGLREAGAHVDEVVAYRNVRPEVDREALRAALCQKQLDVLTFASPSAVRNLLSLLDAPARRAMAELTLAAIGETTAHTLRDAGFSVAVLPPRPGMAALVAALVEHVRSLGGPGSLRAGATTPGGVSG